MALYSRGRQFVEQGRMPDCIESARYVQRDDPDVTSDIEDFRLLLKEEKQLVQRRVTRSECEVMI